MRRLELTWDSGQWQPEVADMIVDEMLNSLDNPQLGTNPWVRPDSVRLVRIVDAALGITEDIK